MIVVLARIWDSLAHYEYRYGTWIGAHGGHSYCNVLAEKYYGEPAHFEYSEWSTMRFSRIGTGGWGCGYSDNTPGHQHVGLEGSWTGNYGSRWWPLYGGGSSSKAVNGYFWEEVRWVG